MVPVLMVAGRDLRNRWRSALAIALLVGMVGTVVFATAAGARRTGSALDRFVAFSRASDLEIDVGPSPTSAQLAAMRRTPGVEAFAPVKAYAIAVTGAPNIGIASTVDNEIGNAVDRARLVS